MTKNPSYEEQMEAVRKRLDRLEDAFSYYCENVCQQCSDPIKVIDSNKCAVSKFVDFLSSGFN